MQNELQPKDLEQASLFKTRITKQTRHLRRWPGRGITCYRLYEKDIPEIPLVVDRYEDFLHVTEYERPHDREPGRHQAWLELMRRAAGEAAEVPEENVVLKSRVRADDQRQYEKLASANRFQIVREGGLEFKINLFDYVDTGLFLDHRKTRKMVQDEAAGKDFLNLFCYTGSFSVYAAAGGATSTASVDLSNTYLEWAEENFEINGLRSGNHQFIASDAIWFLESIAVQGPRFDLAVVDPPTYSNSKRTQTDWDVQSRHVELLTRLAAVMRPGGVVYFSTNFRRFKLEEEALADYQIREISKQTVPDDFRNRRIHRCWKMQVRG